MKHTPDLITLCIEDLIVKAAQRYVQRRKELRALPACNRADHLRLISEHRGNIERLVMLRASLLGTGRREHEVAERTCTSMVH